jgi:thiol-disulfide isomerase/thioredoxin
VPPALTDAARLRRDGRIREAVEVIDTALAKARANPVDTPPRDRALLAIALSDLYVSTEQNDLAQQLLSSEAAFAHDLLEFMRQNGSPEQVRSATMTHFQLRDRATQTSLLGGPAPEVDVQDWIPGPPTTLAELGGRVVLLEFWGLTCRSCLTMMPAINDLHRRYSDRGLTILALTRYSPESGDAADRSREREMIARAAADAGLEAAVGIAADGRIQQRYGASGLPTFAIIDRSGIVRLASSIPDKAKIEKVVTSLLNGLC